MTRFRILSIALCTLALAAGCYSPRYSHHITTFGDLNVARDQALGEKAEDLDWYGDYGDIRMVVGSAPAGIQLDESGSKLVVEEGYKGRYTVLGSATSSLEPVNPGLQLFWYVPPHDSEGKFRSGWCAWQTPFRILALGVFWKMLPFDWACGLKSKGMPVLHEGELRRMARAMGGNLVIVVGGADRTYVNGAGTVVARQEDVSLSAYVLKDSGEGVGPTAQPTALRASVSEAGSEEGPDAPPQASDVFLSRSTR